MENEKTIWNKTIFSESPHKYDDNFQIMNMQYKLKNSKKKRKENYKNIELLENIYDNTEENIEGFKNKKNKISEATKKNKGTSSKTEGYNEDYTSADTVGYGNLTKSKKNNDLDPNFLGLPDKDYDGVDRPDKGNKDDPRVALIRSINNVFGAINKFNYKKMMNGKPEILISKFKLSYNLLLNLLDTGNNQFIYFSNKSMIKDDLDIDLNNIKNDIEKLNIEISKIQENTTYLRTPLDVIELFIELLDSKTNAINKKKKEIEKK